jgi:hypothetical protein
MYAALHQVSLTSDGLFARGAITFGLFYADSEFVHGPALNEAYLLESRQAVYPRVILDDMAMQALHEGGSRDDVGFGDDPRLIVGDDGRPFVDYLRYMEYMTGEVDEVPDGLRRHRDQLRDALVTESQPREREKLLWLAAYHDHHVGHALDGQLRVDAGPPWRFRMADPDLAP